MIDYGLAAFAFCAATCAKDSSLLNLSSMACLQFLRFRRVFWQKRGRSGPQKKVKPKQWWPFFIKFEWNLYEKVVIFSTFMVKKWIFVIKMYSFEKIMLYFLTWTYQRGALISLHICKHNSAFKWNKRHETRNRKYGFGVFGVYSRSLSFQLVNYCRPQFEGDFPFMEIACLLVVTKKDQFCSWSFLYPLVTVKKRTQLTLSSFIP